MSYVYDSYSYDSINIIYLMMDDERVKRLVGQAVTSVIQSTSDPRKDAAMERDKATFSSDNLSEYMNGGKDNIVKRRKLIEIMKTKPWGDKRGRYNMTREEEHVAGLRGAVGIWRLMREENLDIRDAAEMRQLLFLPGGFELHIGMFIPSILSQGTDEQQATWLPLCMNLQLIGTYAQTELGHGTFLRGLETVAVYDPESERFVIHSPTLTSTKWWPGGLGKTCTHAILMARLVTRGVDYGPHAFIVQIRDLSTHLPLPGVEVGDIGPKMGYNGVDNGFLRFDHFLVPRDAMLMRYSSVNKDGTYVPPPAQNSKASYATMVYVRATIVRDAGDFLGRAATIAVRYTAVRRQSSPDQNRRELQILDYENVYEALIPIIAKTFALKFMGKQMMSMYHDFVKARERNDFSALPSLHALSSGLKAFCTDIASEGIEECRRTCGGQGYSVLSGLPTIYTSYVQNVTWEGDNNVMYLQMARYLIKKRQNSVGDMRRGACVKSIVMSPADWENPHAVTTALKHVEDYLADGAIFKLQDLSSGDLVVEGEAWNQSTMDLIQVSKAHCRLVLYNAFSEELALAKLDANTHKESIAILEQILRLFGLICLKESGCELLESAHALPEQHRMVRQQFKLLCRDLRKNAVALVDSFGYEDYLLNSAIGRRDGNIYEALLEAAQSTPFNKTQEGPGWKPVLRDLLHEPASRL